ncbi:MAG: hypothetical protein AAF658_06320 [Myxococcota bacterium]
MTAAILDTTFPSFCPPDSVAVDGLGWVLMHALSRDEALLLSGLSDRCVRFGDSVYRHLAERVLASATLWQCCVRTVESRLEESLSSGELVPLRTFARRWPDHLPTSAAAVWEFVCKSYVPRLVN